jgi:uncharacterized Zn finger protein (UPF0148 family)
MYYLGNFKLEMCETSRILYNNCLLINMSPSEIDESVKAGADLLLKGWKMMNKACPTCFQPLYGRQGKVVCVNCKKDYVLVDSASEIPIDKNDHSPSIPKSSEPLDSFDFSKLPPALVETAKIMLGKISKLNTKLDEATDPKEITELSNAISSLVESIKSLTS